MANELHAMMRELEEKRRAHPVRARVRDVYLRWRNRVTETPRTVRWAYQRVVRGWDDRSVWSLDSHLAKTLGAQLVRMSEIAHGYPSEDYPYDQWTADLKRHGEALLTYQRLNDEVFGNGWEADYQPAREALAWVGDNLGALWD